MSRNSKSKALDILYRLRRVSPVQRLFLELILLTPYQFCEPEKVVMDLLEYRDLWAAVIPWTFWTGSNRHPLVPLRSMASKDEGKGFNANTLYIVPKSDAALERLKDFARREWKATPYVKEPSMACELMGGLPEGTSQHLLMLVFV